MKPTVAWPPVSPNVSGLLGSGWQKDVEDLMWVSSSSYYIILIAIVCCSLLKDYGVKQIYWKYQRKLRKLIHAGNKIGCRYYCHYSYHCWKKLSCISSASGTETVAVPLTDGSYKLHGFKWFTSATDADVTLTLARVQDRRGATTPVQQVS